MDFSSSTLSCLQRIDRVTGRFVQVVPKKIGES